MGIECEVVAPSLIPRKPGDKIKTDRRDAEKLALCYQSGTLTPVWVPDAAHEALRDLVRARAATKKDESRAKHRLVKYLLRNGLRHPEDCRAWTHPWWRWVQAIKFDFEPRQVTLGDCVAEVLHQGERLGRLDLAIDRAIASAPSEKRAVIEALQAMRGVAKLTAVTIVTEVPAPRRLTEVPLVSPPSWMASICPIQAVTLRRRGGQHVAPCRAWRPSRIGLSRCPDDGLANDTRTTSALELPIEVAVCRPPRAGKRNRAARCARPSPPTPRRAKRARRSLTSAATRLPSLDATFP
jgi:hypothetical protein